MTEPSPRPADGPASDPDSLSEADLPSPGRAFLVYSGLRLGLLLVSFLVLRLLLGPDNGLLVIGASVLMSALLSLVLLRRQRDAFAQASIARADQRRAARDARRARLEDPEQPPA